MKITKVNQNWYVDGERVNLYELCGVWLFEPSVREKYPDLRPSRVTAAMVEEFMEARKG